MELDRELELEFDPAGLELLSAEQGLTGDGCCYIGSTRTTEVCIEATTCGPCSVFSFARET